MLKTRLIFAAILIAGLLSLLWADSLIGLPIFSNLIVAGLVGCGLHEFYAMARRNQAEPLVIPGVGLGVLLVILNGVWLETSRGPLTAYPLTPLAVVFSFLVIALFACHLLSRDHQAILINVSTTLFGIIYVCLLACFLNALLYLGADGQRCLWYPLFFATVAKCGDSGAYFVGRSLGKRKLAPKTSPNKTVEGAIGGLLTSVGVALLFTCAHELRDLWWAGAVAFGLAVGVTAQFGDLFESALKRGAGVKDSGTFMPAHGGVLDILDSLLPSAPVAYFFLACFRG